MRAKNVTDTLELALEESGCASAHVLTKCACSATSRPIAIEPGDQSQGGPSYVAGELAGYLADKKMRHVRGAPFHPQT